MTEKEKCPHCAFLDYLFEDDGINNNKEYWIYTEIFVYLHNGKDYCDHKKEKVDSLPES